MLRKEQKEALTFGRDKEATGQYRPTKSFISQWQTIPDNSLLK